MIYTSTSIKDVIGRIVRGTSIQDADLLRRCDEWIPEAMGYMKTRVVLQHRWKPVPVEFHKGRIPCGLRTIMAIEYCGTRVPLYSGSRAFTSPKLSVAEETPTLFGTSFVSRETPEGGTLTETQLTQVSSLPVAQNVYYYTELDWVNFSLPKANLILHYRGVPLDDDGFPLIPDNEDYKQAIYWYCRAMLIGAGFKDTVFSYAACEERFEKHAARALGQIRYPSVDEVESRLISAQRFILPDGWADSFFNPMQSEGLI